MTLRHIRIFLAVCENGNNTTRAARALYLAQPAVSRAVAELEEYYGVRLFDRIGRRLYLTEAGRRMWEYAVHICGLFDDLEKGLRGWDEQGVLRVGASITIGSQFLPGYVDAFRAAHPGVDVRVWVGPSEQLEEKLLHNTLDVALMEGPVHGSALTAEEYMADTLAVVCAPGRPFTQGQTVPLDAFRVHKVALKYDSVNKVNAIKKLERVSSPGMRKYTGYKDMPRVINGLGIAIISTSKGVMTNKEAAELKIGGEVLCYVY